MKKIGWLILLGMILAACGPSENDVAIAQAQSAIESARAAQDAAQAAQTASQGVSYVARGQTLILVLLTLIFVILFSLVVYLVIRRLPRIQNTSQQMTPRRWVSGPNAHWRKFGEPDLYQQMLIEQQWLLAQLLSQSHEEEDIHDLPDLPTDWWG